MRYPFATIAPLLAHLTAAEIAELAGVTPRTVIRWRHDGATIAEPEADRLATALHVHPQEVWRDWHADVTKRCHQCVAEYVPNRTDQRFCSPACRNKWRKRNKRQQLAQTERERYRNDPEYAARKRAQAARLYAETSSYRKAQMRRYRAQKKEAA